MSISGPVFDGIAKNLNDKDVQSLLLTNKDCYEQNSYVCNNRMKKLDLYDFSQFVEKRRKEIKLDTLMNWCGVHKIGLLTNAKNNYMLRKINNDKNRDFKENNDRIVIALNLKFFEITSELKYAMTQSKTSELSVEEFDIKERTNPNLKWEGLISKISLIFHDRKYIYDCIALDELIQLKDLILNKEEMWIEGSDNNNIVKCFFTITLKNFTNIFFKPIPPRFKVKDHSDPHPDCTLCYYSEFRK